MKKPPLNNLILITNHFPYGLAEAFLENEINYLIQKFDKVIIISRDVESVAIRKVDQHLKCYRINPESNFWEKLTAVFLYVSNLKKVIKYTREELNFLKNRISTSRIKILFHDLTKALITANQIEKIIRIEKLSGNVTLYSYWLTSTALSLTFIENKRLNLKRVSRAHGGDLYEYRRKEKYLSFRVTLAKGLDSIYTISENGKEHLEKQVLPDLKSKVRISRLGTHYSGSQPKKKTDYYLIVSCSFLVPVKRINLLIDALSQIDNLPIHWIHIGGGELETQLKEYSSLKFRGKHNIQYEWLGSLKNQDILKFYNEVYVDLFINTSLSEGVPVTMMEAQSFGIPIVGPDTGGVKEIVSSTTGRLFNVQASAIEIAALIEQIINLPKSEYEQLRLNAFKNWQGQYNAEKNFSTFAAEISTYQDEI